AALLAEREFEPIQQSTALFIIGRRGRNDNIQAAQGINLVVINLRKHDLFANTQTVITTSVKRTRIQTTKVADTRQRNIDQTIQKFVHLSATQGNLAANRPSFTDLEAGD